MQNPPRPATAAHTVCLLSLFILGSLVAGCPANLGSLIVLALSFLAVLALTPTLTLICGRLYGPGSAGASGRLAGAGRAVVYLLTALLALRAAALASGDFSALAATVILPDAPLFPVELLFLAASVWLASHDASMIFKIALILSVIVFATVLSLALISLPHIRNDAAALIKNLDFDALLTPESWKNAAGTVAALPVVLAFLSDSQSRAGIKSVFLGISLGALLLSVGALQPLLIFEENYLATLSYPYLSSVGILSSDEVFLRMDGFVYIIFYACSLIKTSVCLLAVRKMYEKSVRLAGGKTNAKYVPAVCGILIILCDSIANYL